MTTTAPIHLTPTTIGTMPVEHGILRVPVRHARPDGRTLELRVVKMPARSDAPTAPPVVFLTGGPGLSGIPNDPQGRMFRFLDSLRAAGDVVLIDQRAHQPGGQPRSGLFPTDRLVTRDDYLQVMSRTVRNELEHFERRGIPVDALNTMESADDIAWLARSLYGDHARVALLGWSYGSHLAMAVLKRHEPLVAAAVLAAPEGPDHTLKRPSRIQQQLERIAQRVDAGPGRFDLLGALGRVLERIEREPAHTTVYSDRFYDRPAHDAVFGRFDLEWMFSEAVADTRMLPDFPGWIASMDGGDFSVLGTVRPLRNTWIMLREEVPFKAARYAMDCASGATRERRALIEREARETLLGNAIDFPLPEICTAVGCADLGDEFRAAPRSDTPVLFITGTLDCRTPADNVAELVPRLPNHQHVVVEGAGHGDLLLGSGVQDAIATFLRGEPVDQLKVRPNEPLRG